MISRSFVSLLILIAAFAVGSSVIGQTDASNNPMTGSRADHAAQERPKAFNEMIAKRRAEQERKEYEEMLERGDAALALAEELEESVAASDTMTASDKKKLAELEKLVTKIRKDLGGDGDEDEGSEDHSNPGTLRQAFAFIKSSTGKLVEELKRSTRFSISVAAIETSNALVRVTKLLRLRK
jgi:hypothetical protein